MPDVRALVRKYLPDLIYGANDGVVTTLAVISGVVGASLSTTVILVLGFANLLADGFSMGASNVLSRRSDSTRRGTAVALDLREAWSGDVPRLCGGRFCPARGLSASDRRWHSVRSGCCDGARDPLFRGREPRAVHKPGRLSCWPRDACNRQRSGGACISNRGGRWPHPWHNRLVPVGSPSPAEPRSICPENLRTKNHAVSSRAARAACRLRDYSRMND